MKKMMLLGALLCAALGAVSAQNQWPDIEKYAELIMGPFVDTGTDWKKAQMGAANPEVAEKYASLQGHAEYFDAALEVALYTFYYVFSRNADYSVPPEAEIILPRNNPKLVDQQLGALVYKEMTVTRFLGDTAAVKWEAVLQTITGRGNATRAEIEAYYRQNIGALIAGVVDAEFGKVSFMIDINPSISYNCTLAHSTNNQYVLSYEGYFNGTISTKTLPSASSLEALSSAMSKSGDFSATAFNKARDNASLIPAVIFDGWKRTTPSMVNPHELLTKALTDFYIIPNNANYRVVLGINARALLAVITNGDAFTNNMLDSIGGTLAFLNPALFARVDRDLSMDKIAAAKIPDDPRYGIFTLNRVSGDAIFVNKSNPAALRQLTQ